MEHIVTFDPYNNTEDFVIFQNIMWEFYQDKRILYPDKFSLAEDTSYIGLDGGTSYSRVYRECQRFGMEIKDGEYYIPKGLEFRISPPDDDSNSIFLYRNGADAGVEFDFNIFNVTFTDFGYKCYMYAKSLYQEDKTASFSTVINLIEELEQYGFIIN